MKIIRFIVFLLILAVLITIICMVWALDQHGKDVHGAEESVTVKVAGVAPSGRSRPVVGALCQVRTSDGSVSEYWTDDAGLLRFSAVGKITITPVALPPGYKYIEDTKPELTLTVAEGMTIPAEGEAPPTIDVATTMRVSSINILVRDDKGKGVSGVELAVYTTLKSVNEKIVTGAGGRAVVTMGAGLYRVALSKVPEGYQIIEDKKAVDLILSADAFATLTILKDVPLTTAPSATTAPPEPKTTAPSETAAQTDPTESLTEPAETSAAEQPKEQGSGTGLLVLITIITLLTLAGVSYLLYIQINLRRKY